MVCPSTVRILTNVCTHNIHHSTETFSRAHTNNCNNNHIVTSTGYNSQQHYHNSKCAMQRVQGHTLNLTFCIRRICCHSNEICAPIAKPTNSAQLESTPYSQSYHLGACSSGEMCQQHTDRHTNSRSHNTFHFDMPKFFLNMIIC